MTATQCIVWLVVTVVGALTLGIGLIYLADYIITWNNNRPWKLAKRTWDYTDQWQDLKFELNYIRCDMTNKGVRYRIKEGRLNVKEAW